MLQVEEVMTAKIETIACEASIQEAAVKMRDLGIGSLIAMDGNNPVGVITDRDVCCRVAGDGLDPRQTPVRHAMSGNVTCCFDDQDVIEAARLMQDHCVRRLAVRDRSNRFVGLVSVDDLARYSFDLASDVLVAASPAMH